MDLASGTQSVDIPRDRRSNTSSNGSRGTRYRTPRNSGSRHLSIDGSSQVSSNATSRPGTVLAGCAETRPPPRDIVHFASLLGRRWACPSPGHEICFVDEHRMHIHLSDDQIMLWVTAWYNGRATASTPPSEVLPRDAPIPQSSESTEASMDQYTFPENESVNAMPSQMERAAASPVMERYPPIESRVYSELSASAPDLHPMASLDALDGTRVESPDSPPDFHEISEGQLKDFPVVHSKTIISLTPTSPPPNLKGSTKEPNGRAFRSSRMKVKWLEAALLVRRGKNHLAKLKKRQKNETKLDDQDRNDILRIIADALEMARAYYPPRSHKVAYDISRELQQWLQSFRDEELTKSPENLKVLLIVQTCLLPILLRRISEADDGGAAILASKLVTALTELPRALNEMTPQSMPALTTRPSIISSSSRSSTGTGRTLVPDTMSMSKFSSTSISSIAILITAKELGAETPICPGQHPWLGVHLLRIVEMTLNLRKVEDTGLTRPELDAIWSIGERRETQFKKSTEKDIDLSIESIRPHEVALLAISASSVFSGPHSSVFTLSVLGQTGIPLLLSALNQLILPEVKMEKVHWEDAALIIRALAFLSEHGWVIRGLSFHLNHERLMVTTLLAVFRRPIPERWFSIRFWAMDTVRNMVGQRPGKDLVRVLIEEDAISAFESLFDANRAALIVRKNKTNNTGTPQEIRPSPDDAANIRLRLRQEYQREAGKRAEELVAYIKVWERVADEEEAMKQNKRLQIVSIGGMTNDL